MLKVCSCVPAIPQKLVHFFKPCPFQGASPTGLSVPALMIDHINIGNGIIYNYPEEGGEIIN